MAERLTRGKMVRLRSIEVNVRADGMVHISVAAHPLTEQQAVDLHRLLGDVIEYSDEES